MPTSARKSIQIKISVTPELHERLRELAAQLGQAPATLASLAVGQYVAQTSRQLGAVDRAIEKVTEGMGPELVKEAKAQLGLLSGGKS